MVTARANDGDQGKTPPLIPKHLATLWLDYAGLGGVLGDSLSGLGATAGLRHVGARFNDAANTSAQPAYTLLDLSVYHDSGPLRLTLNVSNASNKHYFQARMPSWLAEGVERNISLTAKYRF